MWRLLLLVVGLTAAAGVAAQQQPVILPPVVQDADEAALLIVPGGYINFQYYQPLGEAIQAASPLRLWVGLVGPFFNDLPTAAAVFPNMEDTLQAMREMGMNTTNVIISGHSHGGMVMQDEEWSRQHGVLAWVLLASFLTDGALPNASLPVMHISGDLDGLVRVFEVYDIFRDLEDIMQEDSENVFVKPVVILQDVNHMHFASGERPALVAERDILSPLPEAEAHSLIAHHISSYLTVVLGLPEEHLADARTTLFTDHEDTQIILLPVYQMQVETQGSGAGSPWTVSGQVIMSAIAEDEHDHLQVNDTIYEDMDAFGESKPSVTVEGSVAHVNTYTHVYPDVPVNSEATTPMDMATKFKSREAIMEVLGPLGVTFGEEVGCDEINYAAFSMALSSSSGIARVRYASRGKPVVFLPDDVKATGAAWLDAHLLYNLTEAGLEVASPSLPTAVDVGFGLGGMHYCKLLTPSRALEYLMVDSLVGTQP